MGGYLEYPEYKDSGVEWLGEIPAHWEAKRIKFVVSKIGSGKTPRGGSEVYVDSGIMLIRSQNVYDDGLHLDDVVFITEEADSLQSTSRVHPKDVLLNITGASIGRASIVPESFGEANVNQHVCILRPEVEKITPKYLHLCLCSKHAKDQIFSYENGISREGLNYQQASNLKFAVPPISEQQSIARFLDYKTAQIDALIAKKENLLAKLAEKRTALISQAVTKGLDPTVPMKDSGIEWLGKIPANWEVKQVKRITKYHKQGYYTNQDYVDDGVKLARITDIDDNANVSFKDMPFVSLSKKDESIFRLLDGDFIFARSGTIGRFGLVREPERSVFASYLILFRFQDSDPEFLRFAFSSHHFKESLISTLHGGANQNVHAENIKEQLLPLPPLSEQQTIARFLDYKTAQIDALIAKVNFAIDQLKEYRTALITNAVTGKIDVRDVKLPEANWLEAS